jgi:hypothetical protein
MTAQKEGAELVARRLFSFEDSGDQVLIQTALMLRYSSM